MKPERAYAMKGGHRGSLAIAAIAAFTWLGCAAGSFDAGGQYQNERAGNSGTNAGNPAGNGSSASGGKTGSGGSTSASGGSSGVAPPSSLPGGTMGSGGASGAGTGGSSGSADGGVANEQDAASDAIGVPDASADAAMPPMVPCSIAVNPISPPRFNDVPAGEGYRMRVGAVVSGTAPPTKPTFRWEVTHSSGRVVVHKVVDGEPSLIEFPTLMEGLYTIKAELVGVTPACASRSTELFAIVPSRRIATFLVRVTPPTARALPTAKGDSPLGILETDLSVQAATPTTKSLEFEAAAPVQIEPADEARAALPAYFVQISSPTSTARHEGYVVSGATAGERGFSAQLYGQHRYDVLVVPDMIAGADLRAPILYRGFARSDFGFIDARVDPGLPITGTITVGNAPLNGARLRLRDGLLTSTMGKSDAQGAFTLQVRAGRFETRVLPPLASGLPEAQLPQSTGIVIDRAGLTGPVTVNYKALPMVGLTVNLTSADGGPPTTTMSVIIESLATEFIGVATMTVPGQGEFAANGTVRLVGESSTGAVVFKTVPRGKYRLTVVPPDGPAGGPAITVLPQIDLGAGPALITQAVTLAKRGQITGRLTPATKAMGLIVRAIDTAEDGITRTTLATVDAEGVYVIGSDPGRAYRLFVEPPADRRVPRVALEPAVRATTTAVTVEHPLPNRVSVTGVTRDRGVPFGGAIIQVFCWGNNVPTCVDRQAADVSSTLPIDETVSGPDGTYQLWLPDPGQP